MRVVLGEITNTVGSREAKAPAVKEESLSVAPEVEALTDCCKKLLQAWENTRARGYCPYLLRHFSQLSHLAPVAECCDLQMLHGAWLEAEESSDSDEEVDLEDSPPALVDWSVEDPSTARYVDMQFEEDAFSDEDGTAQLPSWRQKELCEQELEERLLSMLQQDQEEDWLLQRETEMSGSLHRGDCHPLASPNSAWMYSTPPRRRRRFPTGQAAAGSEVPKQGGLSEREDERRAASGSLPGGTRGLLQVLHKSAERHRPSARAVLEQMGAEERVLSVDWLLESCQSMHFQEVVAFSAISCLDRYIAWYGSVVPITGVQALVLAVVSIALKLHGMSQVAASLREVLAHLGRHAVPIESILLQEREVLQALRFEVSTPTAIEMLGLLSRRCQRRATKDRACDFCAACLDPFVWHLAEFLLHMALREAHVLYAYPSSVLALAAVLLAWGQAGIRPCQTQLRLLVRGLPSGTRPVVASVGKSGSPPKDRFYHRI
mmetsp:Transcript_32280/g.74573  ORF Transcript_32280/g.74573 Transcript_32280/m.74573 type:complete len:490 (-) Transcript_32280:141-1610(-)